MATHITSGTTTASTVSTITFANWYGSIEVANRSSNDIWARFDGVDPTIAGDECFYSAPQSFIQVRNPTLPPEPAIGRTGSTTVKIISAGASAYTISAGV